VKKKPKKKKKEKMKVFQRGIYAAHFGDVV
jgi:hypothetical protein